MQHSLGPVQCSLGLNWDLKTDHLIFKVPHVVKPFAHRGVLSTVNSLYDPLGFVAPVTVHGRFILWELTLENTDWDSPLPQNMEESYAQGNSQVSFDMDKVKLAPVPEHTIPRLELCAAVLAVDLADLI